MSGGAPSGSKAAGLRFGPLGERWVHLSIDMQRLFSEPTEWQTPWLPRVLPNILRIGRAVPERNIFTRFVPPPAPEDAQGTWRGYWQRYAALTLDRIDRDLIRLVPELEALVPPGLVIDKRLYSPWIGTRLAGAISSRAVDTLVITGAETEVCVLAAVMGGIDLGYRIVIVTDAICSSADPTHDAMLDIYHSRFGMQVETITTEALIAELGRPA